MDKKKLLLVTAGVGAMAALAKRSLDKWLEKRTEPYSVMNY